MKKTIAVLVVSGVVMGGAVSVHAQMIPAKPGLWASSSVVMVNGKQAPTVFDIKGAMPEAQKLAIKQAMVKLGLPKNGNPTLTCSTETQVNLQTVMADVQAQGCTPTVTDQAADHINFSLVCHTPQGQGKGTASVTGINTDQVNYIYMMNGMINGVPGTYEVKRMTRFVGADCQNPPVGIDPHWIGM